MSPPRPIDVTATSLFGTGDRPDRTNYIMLDTLGLGIGPNTLADWSGHDSLHVKLPE